MILALALGLAVGSFLNVVIARLPEGRSLCRARSACPSCGAAIAWYVNVPLLSLVALRGRCRACEGSGLVQSSASPSWTASAWRHFPV